MLRASLFVLLASTPCFFAAVAASSAPSERDLQRLEAVVGGALLPDEDAGEALALKKCTLLGKTCTELAQASDRCLQEGEDDQHWDKCGECPQKRNCIGDTNSCSKNPALRECGDPYTKECEEKNEDCGSAPKSFCWITEEVLGEECEDGKPKVRCHYGPCHNQGDGDLTCPDRTSCKKNFGDV